MKNRIMNKLRSQTGASISFALLLFLVCAVLCSVVLTAATASSGRMSQFAEVDQRYYAVTSAAELLKDLVDGKTVSIVTVEVTNYTTTYSGGIAGDPVKKEEPTSLTYVVADKKADEIAAGDYIPSNLVGNAEFTDDTIPKDAAYHLSTSTLSAREFTLTTTKVTQDAGLAYDALDVVINEALDEEGNIQFTLYNKYKAKDTLSSAGEQYKLTLVFGADQSVTTDEKTENVSSTASSDTAYVVETKTTKTTITSLTWNLSEIKTIS